MAKHLTHKLPAVHDSSRTVVATWHRAFVKGSAVSGPTNLRALIRDILCGFILASFAVAMFILAAVVFCSAPDTQRAKANQDHEAVLSSR